MSGLNVEVQEAAPSQVMYLGCVVIRGRIERLKRDTFSCPARGVHLESTGLHLDSN